jgi:hypothetical protein
MAANVQVTAENKLVICGSRQPWPNLISCSGICLDELEKNYEILAREVGLLIETGDMYVSSRSA